MKKFLVAIFFISLALNCPAGQLKRYELRMSLNDIFVVEETNDWKIHIRKNLSLRYANINITPKRDYSFDMQLYFKSDTPDLAQFNSSEKIKQSVMSSSEKYLPHIVEKKIALKKLNVKGWYGWYTVITDAQLVNKPHIQEGEFKFMTRGMIRLSPDSALGFSIMTNELHTPKYKRLLDYICHFTKEKN